MTHRIASCSCGTLTATCEGEPVRVSVCHCLDCQRRTGSSFGAQARFPEDRVTISGEWREWLRIGDAGGHSRRRFCPTCGSTVFYVNDEMPGLIAIPVGAFADPEFPPPVISIYEARKHSWVALLGDGIRHID